MFRFLKKIAKGILELIVSAIVLVIAYIGINEGMAIYVHHNVEERYLSTNENYVYVEKQGYADASIENMNNIMDKYPNDLVEEFKSRWVIVVSSTPPADLASMARVAIDRVSGLNHGTAKTIWISSHHIDRIDEVFAHEFGHFAAFELGGIDYSEEFTKLYLKNKENFIRYDDKDVDEYSVSSTNEFFATLCEQYIRYPAYLEENYKECYDYIAKTLEKDNYPKFYSRYLNEFISTLQISKAQIQRKIDLMRY